MKDLVQILNNYPKSRANILVHFFYNSTFNLQKQKGVIMMSICNTIPDSHVHLIKSVSPILSPNDGRQPHYLVDLGDKIIAVFCSIVNGYNNHSELEESHQQLTQKLNH